jgi:xylan 1,4-beta-xylosidase
MSSFPNHVQADAFTAPIALPSGVPVQLRVEVDEERLYFGYRVEAASGNGCRSSSTPASCRTKRMRRASPTSPALVGMACQDMAGTALHADFDYFEYRERPYAINPKTVVCFLPVRFVFV